MKDYIKFIFILFALNYSSGGYGQQTMDKGLREEFMKYPGVRDFTINGEGDEAYFTVQSIREDKHSIVQLKKIDGVWRSFIPEITDSSNNMEPFFSPDGKRLYFASDRLTSQKDSIRDYDIWYVERTHNDGPWSAPINMGMPINTGGNEFYPSVSNNGNLYFTSTRAGSKGEDDIFISVNENGRYTEPKSLSDKINSEGYEFNSFVSPDESFLIFTAYRRPDGYGSGDLYISWKDSSGEWTEAKNLGNKVNSDQMDYCPYISKGGKNLYFTSKRSRLPDTDISISTIDSLQSYLQQYENGQSRIYGLSWDLSMFHSQSSSSGKVTHNNKK